MTTKIRNSIWVSDDPRIPEWCATIQSTIVRTNEEVCELYANVGQDSLWIAPRQSDMPLLCNLIGSPKWDHRLLILESIGRSSRHYLNATFSQVVSPDDGVKLLPPEEFAEIFASPESEDYFIGGVVDKDNGSVILYRGNLQPLKVPLSWFEANVNSPQPNPDDFEVIDFGQTVRLGKFEAATEAILYEFDPAFRRREKKRRIDEDESFGGALRRLRLQKGLSRSDFSPLNPKEIARIERGEVTNLHPGTKAILTQRLAVSFENITSY